MQKVFLYSVRSLGSDLSPWLKLFVSPFHIRRPLWFLFVLKFPWRTERRVDLLHYQLCVYSSLAECSPQPAMLCRMQLTDAHISPHYT